MYFGIFWLVYYVARLAQSVEHETLNLRVVGSSPTLGAKIFCTLAKIFSKISWQKCRDPGSNRGPLDLQSNALPTELSRLVILISISNRKLKSSWKFWDWKKFYQVPPRFELGSQDSESWVLTITPWNPHMLWPTNVSSTTEVLRKLYPPKKVAQHSISSVMV